MYLGAAFTFEHGINKDVLVPRYDLYVQNKWKWFAWVELGWPLGLQMFHEIVNLFEAYGPTWS